MTDQPTDETTMNAGLGDASGSTGSTGSAGAGSASSSAGEGFGWTEPDPGTTRSGAQAREWLLQLQAMIENVAEQAAPVVREVGAKAAELAAVAGEKAGPFAQRAAILTADAGQKLAVRSRDLAAELRRDAAAAAPGETAATGTPPMTDPDVAAGDPPTTAGIA